MGGFGSGRPAQRPSLWSLYSVRTKQFRQACDFEPGMVGSIDFNDGTKIRIRSAEGCVYVNDLQIRLLWTQPHFGGMRAWFACPACRRRTSVIYGRAQEWACRRCWNGNYPSQKEGRFDRLIRRAGRLRRRFGDDLILAPIDHVEAAGCPPDKPSRMHWQTYTRLTNELAAIEHEAARLYGRQLERVVGRLKNIGDYLP